MIEINSKLQRLTLEEFEIAYCHCLRSFACWKGSSYQVWKCYFDGIVGQLCELRACIERQTQGYLVDAP